MIIFHILLSLYFALSTIAQQNVKRATCTVLSEGYEQIDDAPSINKAMQECGNGGIVVLPSTQIYSVRSPVDLTPCKQCEFQIEGRITVSANDWDYWGTQRSIFNISETQGVYIRSITGSGVIDGNARNYYLRGRWMGHNAAPHLVHITNRSSNVHVDNLSILNPPMRIFRLEGNSTDLKFSRLNITVEGQQELYPPAESETFGFEMADVSNVEIENVKMKFAGLSGRNIGTCIVFDSGTKQVSVKDVGCTGAWGGVLVMIGSLSLSGGPSGYTFYGRPSGRDVSNVYVQNLDVNAILATGYQNTLTDETVSNVTFDQITVHNGTAVQGERCYRRGQTMSGWLISCMENAWKGSFERLTFRSYKGAVVGSPPMPGWGCAANQTLCDIHFEGWPGQNDAPKIRE